MDRRHLTGGRAKSSGTLYVVGTPIGNLADLGPRAREVLCSVEVVAAEDTRRTRGLLSSIGAQASIIACHEHNEERRAPQLLAHLHDGVDVALVSDAGMPLISDPGWKLVGLALAEGIAVKSVPGPSAVTAALSVSGLPTDRFAFEGFLPRRAQQRAAVLERLAEEARTMVFLESVHRVSDTLAALAETFGAERSAAVARELTKVHECVYAGALGALHADLGARIPLLGEFVIVVAGRAARESPGEQELRRIFTLLADDVGAERAVELTAAIAHASRNAVYRVTRAAEKDGAG